MTRPSAAGLCGPQTPLSRRTLVAGGLLAAVARAQAWADPAGAPSQPDLRFEIWRNGRDIGRHTVSFTRSAAGVVAQIEADLVVRIGPVPVFHYHHEATETWRDGRFAGLRSRTTSNGKREEVSAIAGPGGVTITTAAGKAVNAGADAAPLTHWNRDSLRRPLFNPQTGALIRVSVQQRAGDSAVLSGGRTVPATRYTLAGDAQIVDWYDASNVWAALRGKVQDGSYVEYRRTA